MEKLKVGELNQFVNKNIDQFHKNKLECLLKVNLKEIIGKKNPYLFKAKNITLAQEFVQNILDAFLSSSEEEIFGAFLEELAVFTSKQACGGRKSNATGIDLEFENKNTRYIVSIKSGPNWGNKSQQDKQQQDFNNAVKVLRQSRHIGAIQPVLGICYGKTRTSYLRGYLKVVGQNFWYLISGNENLYTEIIEPLGYRAKEHNKFFLKEKSKVINKFTQEFLGEFCRDGEIDWDSIVRFNSGNFNPKDTNLTNCWS
jgi:hypothetical protein